MLLAIAVAACSPSPAQKAEARYAFLKENNGTNGEVCDAARAVQAAYVEQGDAEKFQEAKSEARTACLVADVSGRDMPYGADPAVETVADNLDEGADAVNAAGERAADAADALANGQAAQ